MKQCTCGCTWSYAIVVDKTQPQATKCSRSDLSEHTKKRHL